MAARAAVAAALAEIVTWLIALPRSYWAVLVAVLLVNETWGESIRMALQRFGMTALGSAAGLLLHLLLAGHPRVEEVLLFAGVFFAVSFRQAPSGGSYPWMIFFLSVYVIFFFAALRG
jgi:uncharacterized membrane protein YgaE (UPF0421/DUF939 family)